MKNPRAAEQAVSALPARCFNDEQWGANDEQWWRARAHLFVDPERQWWHTWLFWTNDITHKKIAQDLADEPGLCASEWVISKWKRLRRREPDATGDIHNDATIAEPRSGQRSWFASDTLVDRNPTQPIPLAELLKV